MTLVEMRCKKTKVDRLNDERLKMQMASNSQVPISMAHAGVLLRMYILAHNRVAYLCKYWRYIAMEPLTYR